MQLYFDFVYNKIYDFTTAQTTPYHRLQRACIDKFKFEDSDKVLCIGVGTGNEILRILERSDHVSVTGIDVSGSALQRAYKKASKRCNTINLFKMDTHNLAFSAGTFNKVFCHHLMGFLADDSPSR